MRKWHCAGLDLFRNFTSFLKFPFLASSLQIFSSKTSFESGLLKGIFLACFISYSSYAVASDILGFRIETSVDYLYLKPYGDDFDFALRSTKEIINLNEDIVDGEGVYLYIRPDFESGVRGHLQVCSLFGLNMGCSLTSLHASWTHSKKVEPPSYLFATLTHGGHEIPHITFAKGKWDLNFQSADWMLSYDCCLESGHRITPSFGGTYLCIDQEIQAHYDAASTGNSSSFDWNSKYRALGMKAGLEFWFALSGNFDLYAKAFGSLVTGVAKNSDEYNLHLSEDETDADLSLKFNERLLLPGWHLAMGIFYHECLSGFDVGLRLGYEFMAWHGVANPARFMKEGAQIAVGSSRSKTTFGLQGVIAGLQINF